LSFHNHGKGESMNRKASVPITESIRLPNHERRSRQLNRAMPAIFLAAAIIPILTTIGIVLTLLGDAWHFFSYEDALKQNSKTAASSAAETTAAG
jgi:ABC-type phosphate transport system permease subunit